MRYVTTSMDVIIYRHRSGVPLLTTCLCFIVCAAELLSRLLSTWQTQVIIANIMYF